MKMKKACAATGLTERAIRLYLAKGLLSPQQINGILDFSAEDIHKLKDIALLRQHGFSIEQIGRMQQAPSLISRIIAERLQSSLAASRQEQLTADRLQELDPTKVNSISSLAFSLREGDISSSEPDFGRFDEIDELQRQQEEVSALKHLSDKEERSLPFKVAAIAAAAFSALAAVIGIFLALPRVQGFISLAPLTVTSVGEYDLRLDYYTEVTISIDDPKTVDLLGKDTLVLPCRSYGPALEKGDRFENACQLAVKLTNYDLLQLGVSPFQSFITESAAVNKQWLALMLHALFEEQSDQDVVLWIGEPSNLPPLLWWEES